ncbi:MAG: transposase [Bacteroidales bacterium]|nr:transposase [Bacteroidales bacterium]
MSTFTQILYQIVFSTKNREKTLNEEGQKRLFTYIWQLLQNKKCHLYRIGGVEDHLHIVTHIHTNIAPALLIKDIKLATCDFIKQEKLFTQFTGWLEGYGAFTYHISAKDNLINYVKNQKKHHKNTVFKDEYILLLEEHRIKFEEKYLL